MQKKAVVNVAERIAELKVIPKEKLPATLSIEIALPNIREVRLNYRPICKNIGLSLQFARKYGPAMRFYNPGLEFNRVHKPDGPILMEILVFRKDQGSNEEPSKVNPADYKSP